MHPSYYFFISILIKVCKATSVVVGNHGHNITLPCSYDAHTHGVLPACWGRAEVPLSKCANTVLSSWYGTVDFRQSPRYQFLGEREGDVSLTIAHAQTADSGMYGCRVEVPGLFNDIKVNILLIVEAPMEEEPIKEEPIAQDHLLPSVAGQEILTTTVFGTETSETTYYPVMEFVKAQGRFKDFLQVGNLGRLAAILCTTIIIVLVLVFGKRRVKNTRTSDHAENIYEDVQMYA